jgi:hypothetical protein
MLPDGVAVLHGKAATDPSTGRGSEGPVSAKALRGTANCNMTQVGMLLDGVAVNRGMTCKGALPHLLQPAGAMAGFPLPSRVDCDSETSPERGASEQQGCKDWGIAERHTESICNIGTSW